MPREKKVHAPDWELLAYRDKDETTCPVVCGFDDRRSCDGWVRIGDCELMHGCSGCYTIVIYFSMLLLAPAILIALLVGYICFQRGRAGKKPFA
ncbi:unnamed protein product, partial [Mesorhabditis spiculigera]